MSALVVQVIEPFPVNLTVDREGVGGISGLTPTAAVRRTTDSAYMDWADYIFKFGGWGTKYQSMGEIERGHYQQTLHLENLTLAAGDVLSVEYHVNDGLDVVGDAHDILLIAAFASQLVDLSFLRKMATNRLEERGGNPGFLVLYDDDGITPLKTWQIRDAFGGPIVDTPGTPARRSAAVLWRTGSSPGRSWAASSP